MVKAQAFEPQSDHFSEDENSGPRVTRALRGGFQMHRLRQVLRRARFSGRSGARKWLDEDSEEAE